MHFGRHPRNRKMPQHRPRHILCLSSPGSNLHSPVPVLVARLVRHHLVVVELEDGAGRAGARLRVVHGAHALLGAEESSAERCAVCAALKRRRRCGFEDGLSSTTVGEARGLWVLYRFEPHDCADRGVGWLRGRGMATGGGDLGQEGARRCW